MGLSTPGRAARPTRLALPPPPPGRPQAAGAAPRRARPPSPRRRGSAARAGPLPVDGRGDAESAVVLVEGEAVVYHPRHRAGRGQLDLVAVQRELVDGRGVGLPVVADDVQVTGRGVDGQVVADDGAERA